MTRFRMAMVAIILPVAIAVIAVAIQLAWLPVLPERIVTHWSFGDVPDAYGPAWTSPLLTGLIGLLPALIGGVLLVRLTPAGGPSWLQKLLAVVVLGMAALISVVATGTLAIQLNGGTGAGGVGPIVLWGAFAAIVLGVAGWFIMPKAGVVGPRSAPAEPVKIAPGERVAWVGVARFSLPLLLPLLGIVIVLLGITAYVFVTTGIWGMILIPIVVGVSLLGTVFWHVRADERGLQVRGALGWPLFQVPAADIQSAGVTEVSPMTGEFAGWGIRFGKGRRLGIITRGGQALEVQRRDGRAVVVTVDDAATAAGVLEAYASRAAKG